MPDAVVAPTVQLPDFVACPSCRGKLAAADERLSCTGCGSSYGFEQDVPLLFAHSAQGEDVARVQEHYNTISHDYDDVFSSHVARHYLDKRLQIVQEVLPRGRVLDVGCGTGVIASSIAALGYTVFGVDLSPGMLSRAKQRGLAGGFASFATALPFADGSFDLALTVATMHHLETPVRVAFTIAEMGRVVRSGGHILLWDHNPLNPYWPIIMKRVPQDSGDERLVPMGEILADVRAAGLELVSARRLGLIPDFVPRQLMPLARAAEWLVESLPPLSLVAAHNVVVARKP